jgi:hypothetical protein
MKRVRTHKPRVRHGRSWFEVLPTDPQNPDVVRAKALAHAQWAGPRSAAQPEPETARQAGRDRPALLRALYEVAAEPGQGTGPGP